MIFALETPNPRRAISGELDLAAIIARKFPGVCEPDRVAECFDCRCRHEARQELAGDRAR